MRTRIRKTQHLTIRHSSTTRACCRLQPLTSRLVIHSPITGERRTSQQHNRTGPPQGTNPSRYLTIPLPETPAVRTKSRKPRPNFRKKSGISPARRCRSRSNSRVDPVCPVPRVQGAPHCSRTPSLNKTWYYSRQSCVQPARS